MRLDTERPGVPVVGFSLDAKWKSPLHPLFAGARRFSCLKKWGTSKAIHLFICKNNITATAESMMADTSLRLAVAFTDPMSLERKKSAAKIAGR